MATSLRDDVRQRIADDPRSVYRIAIDADLTQQTLQRFASGQSDLTSERLGQLIGALGGSVKWKNEAKK